MKRIFGIIFIISSVLMAAVGCTQNHGHIGRLFGTWYLYAMSCNGSDVDITEHGDMFWSFQSDIIMLTQTYDHGTVDKQYGTFIETDNTLILDFNHSFSSTDGVGAGTYTPPAWLGLPAEDGIVLQYLENNSNSMTLKYNAVSGEEYVYYFKRTH